MVEYKCDKCSYKTNKKSTFDTHIQSKKHYKNTLKCFNCQKQYHKQGHYDKHICTRIDGDNNNAISSSNLNAVVTHSPYATNVSGNIYHINIHNYKGDARKFIWDLTSDSVKCFDSPEILETLNKEFDNLHSTFKAASKAFKKIKLEINEQYYEKFMSHVYKLEYHGYAGKLPKEYLCESDSDSYDEDDEDLFYRLTDEDYAKLREYVQVVNDFDNIVCYAYDNDNPSHVLQPRLNSHRNLKDIMIRICPEIMHEDDIKSSLIGNMNNDVDYNKKVASNLINNLAIRAIDRVINNNKKPSQRNVVSAEEDIYFKSKFNPKNDLQQLTYNVIGIVFINLESLLLDANEAFPDVEFTDKHVDIDYIKNKISEIVIDITP